MGDNIQWASLFGDATVVTTVILMAYMVLTGRLRSDKNVQEIREDRDSRLAEMKSSSDQWKEAYLASETARAELQQSITLLMELGRTTETLLRSIHEDQGNGDLDDR